MKIITEKELNLPNLVYEVEASVRADILRGKMNSIFEHLQVTNIDEANYIFKELYEKNDVWEKGVEKPALKKDINLNEKSGVLLKDFRAKSEKEELARDEQAEKNLKSRIIKIANRAGINADEIYKFLSENNKDSKKLNERELNKREENFIRMVGDRVDKKHDTSAVIGRIKEDAIKVQANFKKAGHDISIYNAIEYLLAKPEEKPGKMVEILQEKYTGGHHMLEESDHKTNKARADALISFAKRLIQSEQDPASKEPVINDPKKGPAIIEEVAIQMKILQQKPVNLQAKNIMSGSEKAAASSVPPPHAEDVARTPKK